MNFRSKTMIGLSALVAAVIPATFVATAEGATPKTLKAYTTGYSWYDNTPAGSADISHPVLHRKAGGKGTYTDPVTIAVGHSIINGKDILDYPKGTKFYIPNVRKYFIVEDTCGDGRTPQNGPCHSLTKAPKGVTVWLDLWIGGGSSTRKQADDCMSKVTDGNGAIHTAILNPRKDYVTVSGDILLNGKCRASYGNTAKVR
ncbi:hypothetical protein SEA_BELFORT_142 [Streptomyces phage Belfort]|uniref:Uncharacterized protein n=1 Tax=Streptomyces phage Belfort TaxID=2801887 RepID=A0A7T7Z9R7_9CAUD|nr:hypothetical protein SEA_BELFORT_142 [Streptomyces phage Belfort]